APKEPAATTAPLEPSHPYPDGAPAADVVVSPPAPEEENTITPAPTAPIVADATNPPAALADTPEADATVADTATTTTSTTDTTAADAIKGTTKIDTTLTPSAAPEGTPITPAGKARFPSESDSTPTTPTSAERKKRQSLFGKLKSVFTGHKEGSSPP
ncbi:hypothetical protein FRC09_016576, partial [Ceratobasidium sp. 395]